VSRSYDQSCSLASALDRVGERWALLVVRELALGPLRFSDLARAVGGAPTDVLTRRLRDLERDGIVQRRQLGPPVSATAYELTELGRELEAPLLALGRWGLNFLSAADAERLAPSTLANALRVVLRPPPEASLTVQLETGGEAYRLRIRDGAIAAARGPAEQPDLTLSGEPRDVLAALARAGGEHPGVAVGGDPGALAALRAMVVVPERLRAEVEALAAATAVVPVR
jgi:DNA-binding HxlR family transcriptional regulator